MSHFIFNTSLHIVCAGLPVGGSGSRRAGLGGATTTGNQASERSPFSREKKTETEDE